MSVLDHLTKQWQTRVELERKAGKPVAAELLDLTKRRVIWRMFDYSVDPAVAKYCLRHAVGDPLIGTSHVGRLAAPVWEAADGQAVPMLAM